MSASAFPPVVLAEMLKEPTTVTRAVVGLTVTSEEGAVGEVLFVAPYNVPVLGRKARPVSRKRFPSASWSGPTSDRTAPLAGLRMYSSPLTPCEPLAA